jgi:hypothetical protein
VGKKLGLPVLGKNLERRMLREIFEPKRDGIMEGWRNFHSDELHRFYFSRDIIKTKKSERKKWTGNLACMGEKKSAHRVLVGKPERKDH